jgi:type I restriction enzyme S subunit
MSDLPQGWEWRKLGDLAEYLNGAAFKPEDWVEEGMPIIRIQNLNDPNKPMNRTKKQVDPKLLVQSGDILVSWSATLDAFIWDRENAWLNQHIFRVLPREYIVDKRFLFFLLKREIATLVQTEHLHGSTMKHINRGPFLAHKIPLPPLEEQRRIVAKLDVLLGRNKAGRQELTAATQLIKRQRQAVLAQMNEMAANHSVPSLKILDVVKALKTGPFGSSLHKSDYIQNGIPVINPMHINDGLITPSTDVTVSQEKAKELSEFLLQQGDIVIARRGIMGRCAVVTADQVGWLCGTGSMIVRPHNYVLPKYLQLFLSSEPVVRQLEAEAVGSTMINLNQKILLNIPINLPSLDEQREIVRRIEAAFARIDEGEQAIKQAFTLAERLEQATLAKAFRGEL